MTYLRNAWYMAGWDKDFEAGAPKAETILDEPIVLYRTDAGVVAMEDRCIHRLAPLSRGRCEGANLRCMYHGLLFDPSGQCIEIPGQDIIPKAAKVKTYPVVERHAAIWLWMGDPALADESLIPPFTGYRDPAWAMEPGRMDYAAPAHLIHDNLLDLSHIAYVHLNSFSGGNPASGRGWIDSDTMYKTLPRGVRVSRWMKGMPPSAAGPAPGRIKTEEVMDVWTSYDFLAPGIFLQVSERYRRGEYEVGEDGGPRSGEPVFSTFTCQAVTPLTENTACYFFAYGPWSREAERKQFFADLGVRAFTEDREMIEAQHKVIQSTANPRMMPMVMDKAVLTYAGVLKRLLREEAAGAPSAVA
ncbi:MAG TPA: aromatic ring-hydroxylating dioxygenase subunit alpha [Allosphingosinicella sp.]|nr:aromatic ring-hydroxylating dioxygenase subunit alpha [Allosphingosinicella sp.]